jgi:FMN reductase
MTTDNTSHNVTIAGICGSLREDSHTREAIRIALDGAAELGAKTQLIDLTEYELPFCDGRNDQSTYPPDVHRLRSEVKAADGLILGTPEYHGSLSGALKNALDLMGFDEFEGKMIGLVGVAGGGAGAYNSLNTLRTIGRSLHAWVIPDQVSIPGAHRHFDATGNITDEDLRDRLHGVGRNTARFSFLHSSREAREFVEMWEQAPSNPGAI